MLTRSGTPTPLPHPQAPARRTRAAARAADRDRADRAMTIEIDNESGIEVDEFALEHLARHVLNEMGVHPPVQLSVRLVDGPTMTACHERFMNEPGPTDVLAFPMDDLHDQRDDGDDDDVPPTLLGDVVLCPEVAAQQARQAGHDTEA